MTSSIPDDEFERLTEFLDSIGGSAMNLEAVDGFFAALICGPDMVPPSEYLPEIWGPDFSFESDAQADEILNLLMRHWNRIGSALLETLKGDDFYWPVLIEDAEGVAQANEWARGFMRGMRTRQEGWRELLDSDEYGGPLLPMMILTNEHDPDPEMRPRKPISPESREELIRHLVVGLTQVYRFFEPHRRAGGSATLKPAIPIRRTGPKVGRNDPCPCGIGKKAKSCCGTQVLFPH